MTDPNLIQITMWRLAAVIFMAGLGSVIAVSVKKVSHKVLCRLISFAAGALLSVSFMDILPEALEMTGILGCLLSALSGYLLFFLITRFVFHICPACAATHTEVNFTALSRSMILALSIHSLMDGLAVYGGHLAGATSGKMVLFAIAAHKLPEGLALTLVARGAGMRRVAALLLCLGLEGGTTALGGALGLWFLQPSSIHLVGYLMAHVAGGFVFIVVHALLSELIKHHPRSTLAMSIAGALIMLVLHWRLGG